MVTQALVTQDFQVMVVIQAIKVIQVIKTIQVILMLVMESSIMATLKDMLTMFLQ